jgi:hypothetical protein
MADQAGSLVSFLPSLAGKAMSTLTPKPASAPTPPAAPSASVPSKEQ